MKRTGLALFLLLIITGYRTYGDREIDSLKSVLSNGRGDTTTVNALNDLCKKYSGADSVTTIALATMADSVAEKLNYLKGAARATKYLGNGYYFRGAFFEAVQSWNRAMELFDTIGDKLGEANVLSNLGVLYNVQGVNDKAQECLLKSLRISEQLADTLRITSAMVNLGNIYQDNKNKYDKALEYYLNALPLAEAIHDTDGISSANIGAGEIYFFRGKDVPALKYFKEALQVVKGGEAEPYVLNDIGKTYTLRKNYADAIRYHEQALALATKLESRRDVTKALLGIGDAYQRQGNYKAAIEAYRKAQVTGEEIQALIELENIYTGLSASYAALHDYSNAYRYEGLLGAVKDSIYNVESDRKLASRQFDFEIDKKKSELSLKELDLQKQKAIRNFTIGGLTIVLMFFVVVFLQKKRITQEKKRSDELLLNILPEETADELKATGTAKTKSFDLVTVLFTDFKNFTQASERLSPEELVAEINHCYSEFDRIVTRYGIEKIKTIGDAYMCAGGLPVANSTHPEDVVKAGIEMQEFILDNKKERQEKGLPFFELRLGIHTGPVVAGIVGIKKFAYDIWGDTVNTASRMESSGEVGKVNISGATYALVKDKFKCHHRGKVQAKNKGEIDMYFVEGELAPASSPVKLQPAEA